MFKRRDVLVNIVGNPPQVSAHLSVDINVTPYQGAGCDRQDTRQRNATGRGQLKPHLQNPKHRKKDRHNNDPQANLPQSQQTRSALLDPADFFP